MTEQEAREVLLLQAHESAEGGHRHWSAEDSAWATRQAISVVGERARPERFVVTRAALGLQRLLPRDAAARRWLARRAWHPIWVWLGALLGFIVGVVADRLGPPEHVNLLAPAVWVVVLWNLLVYVSVLLPWRSGVGTHLAPWLTRWGQGGGEVGASLQWAQLAAPLSVKRAALVLHVASVALALGLMAGLYLRGLVLDYRAGWQSTFLDAPAVQTLLNVLLAPASALTGIAVPDVAPLRVGPGAPAHASAAPWIHLYAATLMLWVVLPRLALAAWSAWRAAALARRFPLPLQGPYFDALHPLMRPGQSSVLRLLWAAPPGLAPVQLLGHDVAALSEPLTLLDSDEGDALVLQPRVTALVVPAAPQRWWQRWLGADDVPAEAPVDAVLWVSTPGESRPEWITGLQRPVLELRDGAHCEPPALPLRDLADGWLPDGRLLRALAGLLEDDPRLQRLRSTWTRRQQQQFDRLVAELAQTLARTATQRVPLADDAGGRRAAAEAAQAQLSSALQDEWRAGAARLAVLQGRDAPAEGDAATVPEAALRTRVGEGKAAVVGGVTTGALAGLKADIATGGLTMGAGLVAGALIGALTAAGVARGVNVVRGTDRSYVAWDAPALNALTAAWLQRLLSPQPDAEPAAQAAVHDQQEALTAAWKSRSARFDAPDEAERLAAQLQAPLAAALRDALARLHPMPAAA